MYSPANHFDYTSDFNYTPPSRLPPPSSTLTKVISVVSGVAGALFGGFFIAGTALSLTAKIFVGILIVNAVASGAVAISKIAAHILTGKAQAEDWIFLALAVAGAVVGFFIGAGIPGAILGALALPGAVLGLIGVISFIDRKINASSIPAYRLREVEELGLLDRQIALANIQADYCALPRRISLLSNYF